MKIEVSFVQAKTMMKLDILLTSYLLQGNILFLQHTIWLNSLKYLLCWDYLQQIIYHELKVDKWNKKVTNKNFMKPNSVCIKKMKV
jgi:hypothetical protein